MYTNNWKIKRKKTLLRSFRLVLVYLLYQGSFYVSTLQLPVIEK